MYHTVLKSESKKLSVHAHRMIAMKSGKHDTGYFSQISLLNNVQYSCIIRLQKILFHYLYPALQFLRFLPKIFQFRFVLSGRRFTEYRYFFLHQPYQIFFYNSSGHTEHRKIRVLFQRLLQIFRGKYLLPIRYVPFPLSSVPLRKFQTDSAASLQSDRKSLPAIHSLSP